VGLDANQIRTCVCIAFFRTVWLLQFSSRASCFAFALLDGRISVPRHVHISMSVIASFLCPFKFGALSFLSLSPVWWQKTAPQSSCSLFSFCLPSHFWAAGPAVPRPTRLPDAAPSALACLLTVLPPTQLSEREEEGKRPNHDFFVLSGAGAEEQQQPPSLLPPSALAEAAAAAGPLPLVAAAAAAPAAPFRFTLL
jgi:hypothetical protein